MSGDGRGVFENVCGAWRILFVLAAPFQRRRRERQGVRDEELRQAFPGDELVPKPRRQYVHGITVKAPPAAVWPWLAQLGQGRGGYYSYQLLENLVGCRIQNADAVIPSFQEISVGDPIHVHPTPRLGLGHEVAGSGRDAEQQCGHQQHGPVHDSIAPASLLDLEGQGGPARLVVRVGLVDADHVDQSNVPTAGVSELEACDPVRPASGVHGLIGPGMNP